MVEPQGNFPVLTCVPLLVHWVDTVVKGFALPRVCVRVRVRVRVCVCSPMRHGTHSISSILGYDCSGI